MDFLLAEDLPDGLLGIQQLVYTRARIFLEKDIEIAAISTQKDIAEAQSNIVGEALKTARIDIVGGESTFFDQIVNSKWFKQTAMILFLNKRDLFEMKLAKCAHPPDGRERAAAERSRGAGGDSPVLDQSS